jgi:hypothetical protein
MEKVSAGRPPNSLDEAPAACTGAETSVTGTPTSKKARIKLLVFVSRRRPIDRVKSVTIESVLNLHFIMYFLSLHVGLALFDQSSRMHFLVKHPCNCGPSVCIGEWAAKSNKAEVSREVGLAEETGEFRKPERVSQLTRVNQPNSVDTYPARLRKYP